MKNNFQKPVHPRPNWHGYTIWRKLETPIIIACCDCGLAHQFEFKVTKNGKNMEWRCKRHKEATKMIRKELQTK